MAPTVIWAKNKFSDIYAPKTENKFMIFYACICKHFRTDKASQYFLMLRAFKKLLRLPILANL